jgi:hypothetical protein
MDFVKLKHVRSSDPMSENEEKMSIWQKVRSPGRDAEGTDGEWVLEYVF